MKLHAQWITGFVDGEGCFLVSLQKRANQYGPFNLQPVFSVTQHLVDVQVLHALKKEFGCGYVYNYPNGLTPTSAYYMVRKLDDLLNKVIPFFEEHQLKTKKCIEFQRFRHLCLLLKDKKHVTSQEGYDECVKLARALRVKYEKEAQLD